MVPTELLEAIRAFPNEDGPRESLAQWYENRGDLRGELIRLQLKRSALEVDLDLADSSKVTEVKALQSRETEILQEYGESWHEEWGTKPNEITFDRGLPVAHFTWDRAIETIPQLCENSALLSLTITGPRPKPEQLAKLRCLKGLQHLGLPSNSLGEEEVEPILRTSFAKSLKSLDLSDNLLGDELGELFAHWTTPNLEQLNVRANVLHDPFSQLLAECQALRNLRVLNLSQNSVGDQTLLAFSKSQYLVNLQELRLEDPTDLTAEGLSHIVSSPNFKNFQWLDVQNGSINTTGLNLLKKAIFLPSLRGLRIGYNNISDEAFPRFIRNTTLPSLTYISANLDPDGDETLQAIAKSPNGKNIQAISLANTGVSEEGIGYLLESKWCSHIRSLRMAGNSIGDDGVKLLCDSPKAQRLQELVLMANDLTKASCSALVNSQYLVNLKILDLSENSLGREGICTLVQSPWCSTLEKLNLSEMAIDDQATQALITSPHLHQLRLLTILDAKVSAANKQAIKQAFGTRLYPLPK